VKKLSDKKKKGKKQTSFSRDNVMDHMVSSLAVSEVIEDIKSSKEKRRGRRKRNVKKIEGKRGKK